MRKNRAMDNELEGIKRSWDLSAATDNRMKAVHFTINGEPLSESIYDDIYEHIHEKLGFASQDIVLEIGAGSGLLLERIAQNVKVAVGTDISRNMLKLAISKGNFFVQQMDAAALAFGNETFDKVICNSVVQYLPNLGYLEQYFAEMIRVCKLGGIIFIGDLFNANLKDLWIRYQRPLSRRSRLAGLINRLRGRRDAEYLFVDPFQLMECSKQLGCRDFKALLQLSPRKPMLHRMFRYDAVITK
jgi:ubiquinone/menaquinone biosynthesis C-methylase UbiE